MESCGYYYPNLLLGCEVEVPHFGSLQAIRESPVILNLLLQFNYCLVRNSFRFIVQKF